MNSSIRKMVCNPNDKEKKMTTNDLLSAKMLFLSQVPVQLQAKKPILTQVSAKVGWNGFSGKRIWTHIWHSALII